MPVAPYVFPVQSFYQAEEAAKAALENHMETGLSPVHAMLDVLFPGQGYRFGVPRPEDNASTFGAAEQVLADMSARLVSLEARVEELQAEPSNNGTIPFAADIEAHLTEIDDSIQALDDRCADIEASVSSFDDHWHEAEISMDVVSVDISGART